MKCLIVRPPFAGFICDGIKETEYRKKKTTIRGRIGIIEAGTSKVIGDVELWNCEYNPDIGLWEWQLSFPRKYFYPFVVQHKKGAITWMDVDYNENNQVIIQKVSNYLDEEKTKQCCELEQKFIQEYMRG